MKKSLPFLWSVQSWLQSEMFFYQIPLTWWKTYVWMVLSVIHQYQAERIFIFKWLFGTMNTYIYDLRCRIKTVLALVCSPLQKDDSVIGDRWVLRVGLRLLLQQQQAEHILRFCCLNLSEQRSKDIHAKYYSWKKLLRTAIWTDEKWSAFTSNKT